MNDGRTGTDRKSLTQCLAAYGQACGQGTHQKGYNLGPGKFKAGENGCSNGCGGTAGYNTADITNNVIADRTDTLGIAQKADGLLGTGHFSGSHGMERFFIRTGHSHTNNIEYNTNKNNDQQNQKGHRHGTSGHEQV